MGSLRKQQAGFGHLMIFVLVAVVLAAAMVSYKTVGTKHPATTVASTTHSSSVPQKITSKADISQAQAALTSTDIDSSLNPSQLDADIAALL